MFQLIKDISNPFRMELDRSDRECQKMHHCKDIILLGTTRTSSIQPSHHVLQNLNFTPNCTHTEIFKKPKKFHLFSYVFQPQTLACVLQGFLTEYNFSLLRSLVIFNIIKQMKNFYGTEKTLAKTSALAPR